MKRLSLAMAVVLAFSANLLAQSTAAVQFLQIAPGAKAGGMGEGGVALATDATAIYWNPAGLAFQYEDPETDKPGEISLMHAKWLPQFNFDDLFYDYLAARYYVEDVGMLGASLTYLNLGKITNTDENGNILGDFEAKEYAITLSYSTKMQENLGLGVNLKIIQSNLAPQNIQVGAEQTNGQATAFALDLGVLWQPDYDIFQNKLRVGANLSNFGPAVAYNDDAQADPLPTNLRVGLAYKVLDDEFNRITLIYDATKPLYRREGTKAENFVTAALWSSWVKGDAERRWKEVTHSFGAEYWYGNLIALRTGYFYEADPPFNGGRQFLTFGAGLVYDIFGFDFGYISDNEESPLADTMRFSLSIKF